MNGLNKAQGTWYIKLSLVAFLFLSMVGSGLLYYVPFQFQKQEEKKYRTIRNTVLQDLENVSFSPDKILLLEPSSYDVVIKKEDSIIFSTVPLTDFDQLNALYPASVVSATTTFNYTTQDKQEYQVWLNVYRDDVETTLSNIYRPMIVMMCVLGLLLIFVVFSIFKQLVNPIKRLKYFIFKIARYELEDIDETKNTSSDYDSLTTELIDFAKKFKIDIEQFGHHYKTVEHSLVAEKALSTHKKNIANALIHDLKTPISISEAYIEYIPMSVDQRIIAALHHQNEKIISGINEVLQLLNSDKVEEYTSVLIDLHALVRSLLKENHILLSQKQMRYTIETDEKMTMLGNPIEIKHLLANALINAYRYGESRSIIEIDLKHVDRHLVISIYNETKHADKIEYDKVFNLFYRKDYQQTIEGSGMGMYVIAQICAHYQGHCRFEPYKKGVRLILELPGVYE